MSKSFGVDSVISHYRITSKIGAGGMGEVYLAQDTKLDRKVALKILPAEFAEDNDRMSRFVREAKSASALNHPNIITIYEIGESDGTHFIATEYIDGKTLSEYVKENPLNYRSALEIAIQVASALDEAHSAGIVHRDIKPDNVMVRSNGLAKVLDFGIAKLSASPTSVSASSEDVTAIKGGTAPGIVIGTANYMSPEQAKGKEVDARTDIFSFGVVLYEMIAGQLPFEGENALEMIGAILHKDAKPLNSDVPAEVSKLISKCLRKDRDERYQTIKDVGNDLKDLKQELELKNLTERTVQFGVQSTGGSSFGVPPSGGFLGDTQEEPPKGGTQSVSSAEYLVSQVKGHKKGVLLGLVSILVIAAIGFGVYKFAGGKISTSAPSFESMKITRLTDTGKAGYAAISPDGKYVLHVKEDAGQESLWVRQITTGSNVQIVPPAWGEFGGMTFTPDGDYVFFIGRENSKGSNQLFQIPVLGGEPKKLLADVHSPVTFSPDGKRIAFVRFSRGGGSTVMIANADGSGEQTLATMPRPDSFTSYGPAWSPDGKVIATAAFDTVGSESFMNIVEIRVEDGSIKPVGSQKWSNVSRVAWLADGSGIITTCGEKGSNTSQVYEISYPGGEPRKITNDLNYYSEASLTGDSGSLVTVQRERVVNIWAAPDGDIGRARQLTHGSNKEDGDGGLQWTPDGKIVYTSRASGNYNLWIMNGDGSSPRQLTRTVSMSPAVSSDGRYLVFSAPSKDEKIDIWRMDIDGSNPKQLTNSGGVGPEISPDGNWVIYSTIVSGVPNLWKVSIDGGESVQLTDYISLQASISPDGKSIACYYREQSGSPMRLAIIPYEGGQPTKVLDFPPDFSMGRDSHWLPDGRSIAYVVDHDGVSNIWSMPIDGGAPKQLTNFTTDQIENFALSRDGKPNLFSRGATTRDVVLISGFRR